MILGTLIILIFIFINSIIGVKLLRLFNIKIFDNYFSLYIVGFVFFQVLSFVSFLIGSGVFKCPFYISFLPFLFVLWIFYDFLTKKIRLLSFRFSTQTVYSILGIIVIVLLDYWLEVSTQIKTVISNTGVLYQDVVYHTGISNAIIEFGYPIKDLQYSGEFINYHFFTHFIAGQFSYISTLNTNQVYVLIVPVLSVLIISMLLSDITQIKLKKEFNIGKFLAIALLTFFGAFLIGHNLSVGFLMSLYFSYSYQWQLIFFLLILFVIIKKEINDYKIKDYIILTILFSFSILTKGSSLPLILGGFGLVIINKVIQKKRIIISDVVFLAINILIGVGIYLFFFSTNNGVDFTSLFGFNANLTTRTLLSIILNKLGIQKNDLILIIGLFVSIISYRYYLFKHMSKPEISFTLGTLFIGLLFFLFYTNNPIYFLLPVLFISNLLVGIFIVHDLRKISKFHLILLLTLVGLTIYPVSSIGLGVKKKLLTKSEKYFPLSQERINLYQWIKENTKKNDVIFTPSIYSTLDLIPDNYYPAAMGQRNFLLGGYRFGNVKYYDDFSNRLYLVNNFNIKDQKIIESFKRNNIKYVLIESDGNFINFEQELKDLVRKNENSNLKVVYNNSAGIILIIK